MPKPIKNLSNMEIDEISLVDKGANQHAMVTIAKRAPEEDLMPELYNKDGELLSEDSLEDGDIVFDADGQAYQFTLDEDTDVVEENKELAEVGKSAFLSQKKAEESSFAKSVMEELSKAFSDDERDAVIAKALGRVEELEKQHQEFAQIAKAERDLRLTREYIAKAADYNLPVDPRELGPVLYRMAETMSYEDCSVIAKCLESAGDLLFQEQGFKGGGENGDPMAMVEGYAMEAFGKSADGVEHQGRPTAEMISKVFDQNPEAYDEYIREQRSRY